MMSGVPAFSYRRCESMTQAPMPSLPPSSAAGRGRGCWPIVLVGKYCDHLPFYRQFGIYGREGVDLDRATLADWVGKAAWLMAPLVEAVGQHVMAAEKLHAAGVAVPTGPGRGSAGNSGRTGLGAPWPPCRLGVSYRLGQKPGKKLSRVAVR
jgi:transposase